MTLPDDFCHGLSILMKYATQKGEFRKKLKIEQEARPYVDHLYRDLRLEPDRSQETKEHDLGFLVEGLPVVCEEKLRWQRWPDVLVEEIEDEHTRRPGWLYRCDADWLLYWTLVPQRLELRVYYWPSLQEFVMLNLESFRKRVSDDGFGKSINREVPYRRIPDVAKVRWHTWPFDGEQLRLDGM